MSSTTKPASAESPCPVCLGDHKCSSTDDGLLLCGRKTGEQSGFRCLGSAKGDPQYTLYRKHDPAYQIQPKGDAQKWQTRAESYAKALTDALAQELADQLRLPVADIRSYPNLGYTKAEGGAWTIPEFAVTAAGQFPCGIGRRFHDGQKKAMKGGKRGVYLLPGCCERPGPLFLVEGYSDLTAMAAGGLAAVGRPSNTGGGPHLVRLLKNQPDERVVIVVGEYDEKPDGDWPGRDGANSTANYIRRHTGRRVLVALPPDKFKDVRKWLTDPDRDGVPWPERGATLAAALTATAHEPPDDSAIGEDGRAKVFVTTYENEVNDKIVSQLVRHPGIFQRDGQLVRVVRDALPPEQKGRQSHTVRIQPLPSASLRECVTEVCDCVTEYEANDGGLKTKSIPPPRQCIEAIHVRGQYEGIRPLVMALSYPVLKPDGRILTTPGYDTSTGLYLTYDGGPLTVPDSPTLDDAVAACAALLEVIEDFPFASPAGRSAWIAFILTILARFGFKGPAPFFLLNANVAGAGKTLAMQLAVRIVFGHDVALTTYTPNEDELRKRITSSLLAGEPVLAIDNLAGHISNPVLDAAVTAERWSDRLLTTNQTVNLPMRIVWAGSGNNVSLSDDTTRRTLGPRLESPTERPEDRKEFAHPDIVGWVESERPRLLSAGLTVLRAYFAAGRPAVKLASWASFEGWSNVVRAALVWADQPDPADVRMAVATGGNPKLKALKALMAGWRELELDPKRQGKGMTAAEFMRTANDLLATPTDTVADAIAALDVLLYKRDTRSLGNQLRTARRRVVGDWFFDVVPSSGRAGELWTVCDRVDFSRNGEPAESRESPTPPVDPQSVTPVGPVTLSQYPAREKFVV